MFQKTIAFALALCLALTLCGVATAADVSPLRVIDSWLSAETYQKTYPDRAIETVDMNEDTNGGVPRSELLLSGDWDAAYIRTDTDSLRELYEAGLALDLGEYADVAALASDLYPSIRAAGTLDDKLLALPVCFIGSLETPVALMGAEDYGDKYMQAIGAHMQALGVKADDQPTTFAELCALGERYMLQSKEARKGTTFFFADGASQTACILSNLVQSYSMRYVDDELNVDFDTEVFRAALRQADALDAALKTDPKKTYDADGSCYPLVEDRSNSLITTGTFLKLDESETTLPAFAEMVIVNPKSERIAEAVDYLLVASRASWTQFAPVLYQNVEYDALVRQSYDDDIAAQIEEGEKQSVIDNLTALRDAGDPRYYLYTREEIERYQSEVAPYLVFPRAVYVSSDRAINGYLSGKLDADGMIDALNAAAAEAKADMR